MGIVYTVSSPKGRQYNMKKMYKPTKKELIVYYKVQALNEKRRIEKLIPKKIKEAIQISVEKDIFPSLEQNIGDYVAHYLGKMDVDFENEEEWMAIENAIVTEIWKHIKSKIK